MSCSLGSPLQLEKREHVAGNKFNSGDNCLAQKTQVSNRCNMLLKAGRTTLVMRMLSLKRPLLSANKPDRQEGLRSGIAMSRIYAYLGAACK
jgi:hypothetical protein